MAKEVNMGTVHALNRKGEMEYALLVDRLEQLVLRGEKMDQARGYLQREEVWRSLPWESALRWARLARIAGLRELCLSILNWMVVTWPDREEARDMRTELLLELGRGPVPVEAVQAAQTPPSLDFDDKLTDSFTAMRSRESAVRRYLDLFQGREDVFARQWADKEAGTQGYVPVRRAIQGEDILEHLQGRKTYGIYLLQEDSRVCLAVIDADMHPRLRTDKLSAADRDLARRERDYLLRRLPELGRELGMPCLTEFSGGKGYHFWYFFAEPVPAALPRQALNRLVKRISPDLTCFSLEVFPKQDTLAGKGLGNLVKLPLGIHRVSGKASRFLQVRDPSPWAQLKVLDNIGRIDVEILERHAGGLDPEQGATVLVHPRHQAWADDFPELARLADACPALGQIVASCRMSRTLSVRDEKVILGTLGFLPRAKTLIHHLHQSLPDYNQHLVDYKLSRVRGTPLGCKRIHSLLNMTQDQCLFENAASYAHPLLHLPEWIDQEPEVKSERVENLQAALDSLEGAIRQVRRFLRPAQA